MREMKDSGIEWLGEIPIEWDIQTLKYQTEKYERGTAPDYIDEIMTKVVNQATFSKGYFDTNNIRYSSKDAKTSRGFLKKGDVLLASTGGGVLGKTHFFNEDDVYVADSHVTIVRTIDTLLSKYLYYYFSINYSTFNAVMAEGSTNQTELQRDLLGKMPIPFPSIEEQQAISAYLDKKCSEIDSLTSDIQQQIEILEQYKRSIITKFVIMGLNKSVNTKKTSVEWANGIPVHWSETRIGYSTWLRARLGWKGLKSDEYVEEGYPFLSAFNIVNNNLSWDSLNYITEERYDESPEIMLNIGDILLVKDGAGIGKCARIDDLPMGESTTNGSLAVITTSDNLNYKYLYYYFLSAYFQNYIQRIMNGMGVPHLSQEELRKVVIPLPPIKEQMEIANYLDTKCTDIQVAINEKKQQIETIEEYKKSLIFEYVTGKKEVTQ